MTRATPTLLLCFALAAGTAYAQTPSNQAAQAAAKDPAAHGTVVSTSRTTMVIRTAPEVYQLFVFDRDTMRPPKIPAGASVSVLSRASEDPAAPFATLVRITALPEPATPGAPVQEPDVVPPSMRRIEGSVEREARRFRVGIRSGATLDQELFSLGAHTQIGPFFNDRVYARPNFEMGFGEITTLVALNFEGIYRMPITQRDGRFSVYFGAGPSVNFIDHGLESVQGIDDSELDRFDDFDMDVGFNLLMGVQMRGGLFLELKSAAYSAPHVRFIIGYNF